MASSLKLDDINQVVCIPFVVGPESATEKQVTHDDTDLPDGIELRLRIYQAAWSKCLARIQSIVHDLKEPVVSDVVRRIEGAYEDILPGLPHAELPAISISEPTGDSSTLNMVVEELTRNGRTLVSHLHPTTCNNVMSTMKALISGFISQSDDEVGTKHKASASLANYDIQSLVAWYEASMDTQRSQLVVVFQGFEQFDPLVVQDVCYICSLSVPQLPLVFLLGLSSPPSARFLSHTYSRATLCLLRVSNFTVPHGLVALEEIILKTFFDLDFQPDIDIGPSALNFLIDYFMRQNSGLDAALTILQLVYMKHFENSLTILVNDNLLGTSSLSEAAEKLRQPESFPFLDCILARVHAQSEQADAEHVDLWRQATIDSLFQSVDKERAAFRNHSRQSRIWMKILILARVFLLKENVIKEAPDKPRSSIDLISSYLDEDLEGDLQALAKGIKKLGSYQLRALLDDLHDFFSEVPASSQRLVDVPRSKCVSLLTSLPDEEDVSGVSGQLAESVSIWLLQQWSDHLSNPETPSKLWDIWYTALAPVPADLLNPSTRSSLFSGLLQPWAYLSSAEIQDEATRYATWQLPDTSILFCRYLDSGKMINVYDWFESFVLVLDTQRDRLRERKKQETVAAVNSSPLKKGASSRRGRPSASPAKKGDKATRGAPDDEDAVWDEQDDENWKLEIQARPVKTFSCLTEFESGYMLAVAIDVSILSSTGHRPRADSFLLSVSDGVPLYRVYHDLHLGIMYSLVKTNSSDSIIYMATMNTSPEVVRTNTPKVADAGFGNDSNEDGTFHQLQLGPKAKREHFFSSLDPASADAVHRDAQSVQFTELDEKAVRRKIDNRVLPLVICSYIFNQFDRTNIGNAHVLKAFNDNFGISTNARWTIALSIFYVGYCLLEMPANVLQRHIGANRFFFISLGFWGITSLSFVYAKGYASLLVLRVLLGIGEAGYYAGMIYYLSFWYKRSELAVRISLCMTGTLPGAIGGLLAFGLVRAHTSLLVGWQFLFLIEAIPTLIMAISILLFLPSFPFSADFLSPREKAIAQARLNQDHNPQSHGGMSGWEGFKAIVSDINAWLFMLIYASFNVGVATISYFLPTLIRGLGFSDINAQGLTVAPYVVGWFMVVLQAWHSDRTKDRGYHIMVSCAISFVGYIILAVLSQRNVGASYFALFLVVGGNYSLFPLVMSWAANAFSPTSKRGVGTAFIVSISNCVSIASPQVYFDPEDGFQKGHAIAAGMLALSFITAFTLRTRLTLLNKRNRRHMSSLEQDGKGPVDGDEEIWDTDPRYQFKT
ncbi:hypothetical protein AB1N83_007018 [Pleurotus pulmonarius]